MNPAVVAAIIAASVSVITLIGTLAAQFYGIRKTSSDTAQTREQQSSSWTGHLRSSASSWTGHLRSSASSWTER